MMSPVNLPASGDESEPRSASGPVLILGGGVNGACVARELVLNGVSVVLVDEADLGGGASAKSSRLIHGGLRYLEYGDIGLVRESLGERTRLLKLAPHLVRPLKLHIPIARRTGGLLQAGLRFLGLSRLPGVRRLINYWPIASARGLWAVRIGLALYDRIATGSQLPRHTVTRRDDNGAPTLDRTRFRWVCSYWDAHMAAPERFVIVLLRDAEAAARANGVTFEVLPYHRARLMGDVVELHGTLPSQTTKTVESPAPRTVRPAAIVNATGPWGDWALQGLPVEAPRLCGGTKGSHFVTHHAGLLRAIGDDGVYAEARDGRLVFILPWNDAVLVGTTDERFAGRPEDAIATEEELSYLLGMVNELYPQLHLTQPDVDLHYSGVRPLPFVPAGKAGAIPRDHSLDVRRTANGTTIYTLIGGKLTTCRAFGAIAADAVLEQLGVSRTTDTTNRPLPGATIEMDEAQIARRQSELAAATGVSLETIESLWRLLGTDVEEPLLTAREIVPAGTPLPVLEGTDWPLVIVDEIIRREWVTTTTDLVERRLMLVFSPHLSRAVVEALAARVRAVRGDDPWGTAHALERLRKLYGVELASTGIGGGTAG